MRVIEDMEEVEVIIEGVILEEVVFMEELIPLEEMKIIGIEIEKIEGLGGQSRSRERERARSQSITRSHSNSRPSMNRDRVRCFRCREYDHFANKCPNLPTDDSDRESDGA